MSNEKPFQEKTNYRLAILLGGIGKTLWLLSFNRNSSHPKSETRLSVCYVSSLIPNRSPAPIFNICFFPEKSYERFYPHTN